MTRHHFAYLLSPCLIALCCAAQQPSPPAAAASSAPSQAQTSPAPAAIPANKEITDARAKLKAVESAGKGNTTELAGAINNLISAQLDANAVSAETLELATRELAVAEAAAGERSRAYVNALGDNSEVRVKLDRVAEARPWAEQALEIAQREFPETEEGINAADELAFVCNALGDIPCTRRADELAISIERKTAASAGPDREWDLAYTLNNYADLLRQLPGQEDAAGAAELEAYTIARRVRPDDIHVGLFEQNLATHYMRIQDFPRAIEHFNSTIVLLTKSFGPDSPWIMSTMGNLASVYSRSGQFDLAWKSYERALDNPGETWDVQAHQHADFARSLASGGKLQRAIEEGLLANRMGRESFSLQARLLPERQALAYDQRRAHAVDTALSVLARHPDLPSATTYEEVIRSRALVADEMARRQRNLNALDDPEVARLLDELNRARADLLALEKQPRRKNGSNEPNDQATDRMEKIERQLAERSAAVREDRTALAATMESLRKALPPHSALVSYVSFGRRAVEKVDPARTETPSYMAFVLLSDSSHAKIFDLGEAKPIEDAIARMRASADAEAHGTGLGSTRNERAFREAGLQLRRLAWDPLQPAIAHVQSVIIVPDGLLHLVPFAALPVANGYLVERPQVIRMISSERDLLVATAPSTRTGLLAIGSPQFDVADSSTPPARLRDTPVSCEAFQNATFAPLASAATEVRDIGSTWQRFNPGENEQLFTGDQATRARFLDEAPRSRVLHLATHAFLLDRSCGDGNPLLHSGLVFAGANRNRQASILTAQQIASLDLRGVDWAVLSACNTGGGELSDGEGVLGLERAFRIAGARSVVMTLWPVDDHMTATFMHEFYTERLVRRASTAEAAWGASSTLLRERRSAGQSTHPWYWAGYVASGLD
ncbi:MAG TPA: CHAT domain-containing tetratricopeptide repeat protein [Terracidiphilus sp.]|nr:CHAT domain-containing tetratricopeptide repeat protein [Terracidiphilus sp.]